MHINFHFQIFISSFANLRPTLAITVEPLGPTPKIINFHPSGRHTGRKRSKPHRSRETRSSTQPCSPSKVSIVAGSCVSVRRQVGAPASINPKGNFRGWIPWGSGGTRVYVCFSLSWERVFRTRKAGPRVRDGGGHVSPDGRMRTNPKALRRSRKDPSLSLSLARSLAQRHPLSLAPSRSSLAAASTRCSPLACQSAPRFRRESSFIRRGVTPTPRWMLLNRVLVSAICIVARFLAVCPAFVEGQ